MKSYENRNRKFHKLIEAFRDRNLALMNLLLVNGSNPNETDDRGNTPLMYAAYEGNVAAMRILLNHNADVNIVTKKGGSALLYAALKGMEMDTKLSMLGLLLNRKELIIEKIPTKNTGLRESVIQQF